MLWWHRAQGFSFLIFLMIGSLLYNSSVKFRHRKARLAVANVITGTTEGFDSLSHNMSHIMSLSHSEQGQSETLMCVIITFKTKGITLAKAKVYENTIQMYQKDLSPEVRLFVDGTNGMKAAKTNEHNTPLLHSLLATLDQACPSDVPYVAYANADILFEKSGLISTLQALLVHKKDVLIVGQRRNSHASNITQDNIRSVPTQLFQIDAQDYFLFSRNRAAFANMPSFVIGRRAYDNAIVDWAFHNTETLVDATQTIWAVHQTTEDGNFAGHSPLNADKEHNVKLKGIEHDHGTTLHARFETSFCASKVCLHNRLLHLTPEMQNALRQTPCNGVPEFCDSMLGAHPGGFEAEETHRSRLFLDRNETLWLHGATIAANGDVMTSDSTKYPSLGCSFDIGNAATIGVGDRLNKVVVITQYWGEGFFHTMIEGMPRLAQAMHDYPLFFAGNDVDVHVSLGAALGKANELLRIIGFVRPPVSGNIWASEVLLAPPTPCGGHVTGRHNVRLRALFKPFLVPQTAKVLISKRRHGSSRSITNHEALLLAMRQREADVQEHTGHEPLLTQMQMFAGAHVVVGPHGSGLANIIAMPEAKHVFEFLFVHGAEKPNYCYATLALSLGLHYWSYYEPKAEWASPWAVDVDKVVALMRTILAF